MSYLEYFIKNCQQTEINDTISGTCTEMCPKEEVEMREKNKMVHVLETVGENRKLIKSFSRSAAADSKMCLPHLLRPFPVLKRTLEYLLLEIINRRDVPTPALYDFINDRLRCIRQDMIVQRIGNEQCKVLLEPMVRFYVYYSYVLYGYPLKDYDPVLNKKFLLECLQLFLRCHDRLRELNASNFNVLEKFSYLKINVDKLPCDPMLMEALYILCNLEDIQSLYRYLNLPKDYKCNKTVQLAYKIAIANYLGNYVQMFRLAKALCPLTSCAFHIHLSSLQRRCLLVMSHAYNSARLCVPTGAPLRDALGFVQISELERTCRHYGLKVTDHQVKFCKADFNNDAPLHQSEKELIINDFKDVLYCRC